MAKMIEVDEEEFRKSETLRKTVAEWMKNPAARRKLLEANKAYDPKAEIPELDQPDPIEARVAPVMTEVEALKKQLRERDEKDAQDKALASLTNSIEKGFQKLRSEEQLTTAGEESVRKLMEEKGITDPEIAWAYHQRLHPPQSPIQNSGSGAWNFLEPPADDQVDLKRLIETKGESIPLIDKMARDALADIRGQQRR